MNKPSSLSRVKDHVKVPENSRFAQYGLALGRPVLRALEKRGIYCHAGVSIEHQHLAKRYVLRGTESGGAVADMARDWDYLKLSRGSTRCLRHPASPSGDGRPA